MVSGLKRVAAESGRFISHANAGVALNPASVWQSFVHPVDGLNLLINNDERYICSNALLECLSVSIVIFPAVPN